MTVRSAKSSDKPNTVSAIVDIGNHTEEMDLPLHDLCSLLNIPEHIHGVDPILLYIPIELGITLKGTEVHHMELVNQNPIDSDNSGGISNASTVNIGDLQINSSQESNNDQEPQPGTSGDAKLNPIEVDETGE